MHQARPLVLAKAQPIQQSIHTAIDARTALARQTRWLVQNKNLGVFVDDKALNELLILRRNARLNLPRLLVGLFGLRKRRNANGLPRLKPIVRLHPPTINTHLPRAQQLLEPPMREIGKMSLE